MTWGFWNPIWYLWVWDFFKELQIPTTLAGQVQEIYRDSGNDVYLNIIPLWGGEDHRFDLAAVSPRELQQFPNSRKATILSSNFDQVKAVLQAANVAVERSL